MTALRIIWGWKPARYTALLGLLGLILFALYLVHRVRASGNAGPQGSGPTTSAVLPKDDSEQIIVDPSVHTLIIKRASGTTVTSLPDRPTVIDIRKNGTVGVTSPQFGLEHRLFVGIQVSDALRLAMGMDGLYWKRLDLGIGMADQIGRYVPVGFVQISYNVWSNCRIGLTYDTHQRIGAALTVRL